MYLIGAESEEQERYQNFLCYAEPKTGKNLNALKPHGRGEYVRNAFSTTLCKKGISSLRSCAYTSQQNGIGGSMNYTLRNMARSMPRHQAVPKDFWADANVTPAYIKNRLTITGLSST